MKKIIKYERIWDCDEALDLLKEKLVTTLILIFLDLTQMFHIHIDASSITLGKILPQLGKLILIIQFNLQVESCLIVTTTTPLLNERS